MGITDFFTPEAGQRRRAWLNSVDDSISEAARYYLGPTGLPERASAAASVAGMFSPGADMMDAAESSRNLMRAQSPLDAATAGAGLAAAFGSMLLPGSADDAARALSDFAADESGALRVFTGGVGDPMAAAADRGAWFSETPDLAREYAGTTGRVQEFIIDPKRPISFRHAEQRRPLGDLVSTALNGVGDVVGDDAAKAGEIIDRLYARYGSEPRPLFEYWNRDSDIANLFRTLGYDAISTAEKADMRAQTWGVLNPGIMQPVQQSSTPLR